MDAQLSVSGSSGNSLGNSDCSDQPGKACDLKTTLQQQPAAAADASKAIVELRVPAVAAVAAAAANDRLPTAGGLAAGGAAASAGVGLLDSLMNISNLQYSALQQPALVQLHQDVPQPSHTGGAGAAAAVATDTSRCLSSSCLCMLQLTVRRATDMDSRASLISNGISSSNRSNNNNHFPHPSQAAAAPSSALAAQQALPTRMLNLHHVRLPNLLAVQQQVVAVASTTGSPVVSLCSFSESDGLQLLHVVELPLPLALNTNQLARLEGLLLVASGAAKDVSCFQCSSSSSHTSSSITGVAMPGVGSRAAGSTLLPEVVAFLACSQNSTADQQPRFASFGTLRTSPSVTADLYLAKYALPQCEGQQHKQQQANCLQSGELPQKVQQHSHGDEQRYGAVTMAGHDAEKQQQQQQQDLVVAALERLQVSMERRLDAIHDSLGRLVHRVQALEAEMI
jgi:hypothetical protein